MDYMTNYITTQFFFFVLVLFCLQMIFTLLQLKQFQAVIKKFEGSGIIGVGHRKGIIKSGEILVLSYNLESNKVVACESLTGITIFSKFKKIESYIGLTLVEIREIGLELDMVEFKRHRKTNPYNKDERTKKKGALIQAVDSIEYWIEDDAIKNITSNSGKEE